MTISLISSGEHFDYYTKVKDFFGRKGITYMLHGPYSKDHKVTFNLPLVSTDNNFYKTLVPFYSYKSDLADWVANLVEQNCSKKRIPLYGLIILFGEEGNKVKKYLDSCIYHEVKLRISIITNKENFEQELEHIWDKFQLFCAKEENKRLVWNGQN